MIIGLFPHPVVCGWCSYSVFTAIGLDPGRPGGPLSAPGPGGPLAPFLPCLAGHWVIKLANSLPVLWIALLGGWLVCSGCVVL